MSGVMCDKRASPARMERQETELEIAEVKMLRLSLGVTRMDRIRDGGDSWM